MPSPMKKKTQKERVLEFMEEGNSITPIEALERFGCFRLAHIIWEIRKDRHVYTRMITHPKYGTKFAEYSFKKHEEEIVPDVNDLPNIEEEKYVLVDEWGREPGLSDVPLMYMTKEDAEKRRNKWRQS